MAGVIKSVDPELGVYDFNHGIAAYDIRDAAYQLSTVLPFWPAGTVFVSVVDPGVGTERRGCVARLAKGSYVVSPDNGTLTMVADAIAEVRAIDVDRMRLPGSEDVHIFHGRDLFSYTAARLASGQIAFEDVGPAYDVADIVRIALTDVEPCVGEGWAEGGIYNLDMPYGCARINIPNRRFQSDGGFAYGDDVHVRVSDGERIVFDGPARYARTFGDVEEGMATLVGDIQHGEAQMLRFNTGDFVREYAPELEEDPGRASTWRVRIERAERA